MAGIAGARAADAGLNGCVTCLDSVIRGAAPDPSRDRREQRLAILSSWPLLVFVQLTVGLALPFADAATDLAFVINMATSCVPDVFAKDGLSSVYYAMLAVACAATVAGVYSVLRMWQRCLRVWRNPDEAFDRADAALVDPYAHSAAPASSKSGSAGAVHRSAGGGSDVTVSPLTSVSAVLPPMEAADAEAAAPPKPLPAGSDSVGPISAIQALRLFAHLTACELAQPGALTWSRRVRLTQALLEDAAQVAVSFALIVTMKTPDTSTMLSLYTSSAALCITLGTELHQVLHCLRQRYERAAPPPPHSVPAPTPTPTPVAAPPAPSRGIQGAVLRCSDCLMARFCAHPSVREAATSGMARTVCTLAVVVIVIALLVSNQVRALLQPTRVIKALWRLTVS